MKLTDLHSTAKSYNTAYGDSSQSVLVKDFPKQGDVYTTMTRNIAFTNSLGVALVPVQGLNSAVPFEFISID